MRKMALVALSAAGIIAGCQRAPVFPEILMTYHDVEWLKANEDQIPVRSEEHTSELPSLMRNTYGHPLALHDALPSSGASGRTSGQNGGSPLQLFPRS